MGPGTGTGRPGAQRRAQRAGGARREEARPAQGDPPGRCRCCRGGNPGLRCHARRRLGGACRDGWALCGLQSGRRPSGGRRGAWRGCWGRVGGSPTRTSAQKPKTVTLSATPAGVGQVGAIVKVTITNNTDSAVIIMPSMVKGDGRAAVVGEGTLAPGSREVQPGETVTGTVEFASQKAPGQAVLVDRGS